MTWDASDREPNNELVHDALVYGSDDELLEALVPFLRAGLQRGDRTVVVGADRTAALLSDALHADSRVTYLSRAEVYRRVPAALGTYRELMERELSSRARRVRVIAEIAFGADPAMWTRYEAIVNRAFRHYPMWAVCVYDRRRLPADVVAAAALTHPYLVSADGPAPSGRYVEPAGFLRGAKPAPDLIEVTTPLFVADDPVDLYLLRQDLHGALRYSALPAESVHRLVFAINEVTTNAVVHGRRPLRVRLWVGPDGRAVCAVTDRGTGFDDPFAGYLPAGYKNGTRGIGLWLARQFCDDLTTEQTPDGFTVRLRLAP